MIAAGGDVKEAGKPRRRALQDRTLRTRARIAQGAIEVLARAGVAGLTHRAVAKAAGVGLAATTYHFEAKADILAEASRVLLAGYLHAFRRFEARLRAGEVVGVASLDDLVTRVVLNALGRERTRSLAWLALALHGGRSSDSRTLAQGWYAELDAIWSTIGGSLSSPSHPKAAGAAVDRAIGLTFLLQPLALDEAAAADILGGRSDIARLANAGPAEAQVADAARPAGGRSAEARARIVQTAIDILVEEGAGAVSYGAVARRAGMVRSGPSYHFPSIGALMRVAQMALFERAKARYRAGFGALAASEIDEARLVDLTTAIYFREVLEFAGENIGYHSVWLSAAHDPALRPAVLASLLDQHRAWLRRLEAIPGSAPPPDAPLMLQAVFVGKLIRAVASGAGMADLARAREDFAAAIARARGVTSQ